MTHAACAAAARPSGLSASPLFSAHPAAASSIAHAHRRMHRTTATTPSGYPAPSWVGSICARKARAPAATATLSASLTQDSASEMGRTFRPATTWGLPASASGAGPQSTGSRISAFHSSAARPAISPATRMWITAAATSMPSIVLLIKAMCVLRHPLGPGDAAPLNSPTAHAMPRLVIFTGLRFRARTPAHAAAAACTSAAGASTGARANRAVATRSLLQCFFSFMSTRFARSTASACTSLDTVANRRASSSLTA